MENTIPKSYEEAFRDLQSSPVGSITILRKILQAFREEIKLHTLPQVMQQSAAIQRMASDILTASRDLDDACVQLQEAINQDDTRAQQLEEPLYSPVPELPDKSSSYLAMGNPRTPMFAPIQDIQDEAQYSVIPSPSSSQLNISDGAPMNLDIRDNAMTPQHTPKISSPNFPATNSPPSPPSGVQPVIAEALSYAQPLQSDCYIETEMCSGSPQQPIQNTPPQVALQNDRYCVPCSRQFGRHQELTRHIRTSRAHAHQRKFVCDRCQSSCTRQDVLLRHQRNCGKNHSRK